MRNRKIEDVSSLMDRISFENAKVSEFEFSLVNQTLSLLVEKAVWVDKAIFPLAPMKLSLSGWKRMEWQRLNSVDEEYGEPVATELYEPLKEISIRHGQFNMLHIKGKGTLSNEWFDLKFEGVGELEFLFEQDDMAIGLRSAKGSISIFAKSRDSDGFASGVDDLKPIADDSNNLCKAVGEEVLSLVEHTLSLLVEKAESEWVDKDIFPLATMRLLLSGWKRIKWQRLNSVDEKYRDPIATELYEPLKEISIRPGRFNMLHIKGTGTLSNEWFDLKFEGVEEFEFLFEQDDTNNLCKAAEEGSLSRIIELLGQGIDPNIPRRYCAGHYIETVYPLIEAVRHGNLHVVKLLIEKGADVNVSTRGCGETPLHRAFFIDAKVPQQLSEAERKARRNEMVKLLVEQGAKVNVEAAFCLTPLHLAVYQNNIEMVQYLIQHGADVNLFLEDIDENESRATALGAAVQENNLEMVKLLIKLGADPSLGHGVSTTPIKEALELGNGDIIHALKSAHY